MVTRRLFTTYTTYCSGLCVRKWQSHDARTVFANWTTLFCECTA